MAIVNLIKEIPKVNLIDIKLGGAFIHDNTLYIKTAEGINSVTILNLHTQRIDSVNKMQYVIPVTPSQLTITYNP